MTVLITASNKSIGFAIAELFAKTDYKSTIILTSRNLENGERALATLKNKYPNTDFDLHQLDITFQSSRKTLIL